MGETEEMFEKHWRESWKEGERDPVIDGRRRQGQMLSSGQVRPRDILRRTEKNWALALQAS